MSTCPKCQGSMSEGFIVDRGAYDTVNVSTYQPGEPQKSFWLGIKADKKAQLEISTMRCNRCGYLEQYARA